MVQILQVIYLKDFSTKKIIYNRNILNSEFSNDSFDGLISTMVIEHVDENTYVSEVHRILKKSGIALIASVLQSKYSWYFYRNENGETVIESSHLKEYKSLKEFKDLFINKFYVIDLKVACLKYPVIDPVFKVLNKFFKKIYLEIYIQRILF